MIMDVDIPPPSNSELFTLSEATIKKAWRLLLPLTLDT
jgi:hypothetical protein